MKQTTIDQQITKKRKKFILDDFYDLNSGVDAVIKKGYVNEDQLYLAGGSGGVLTDFGLQLYEVLRLVVCQDENIRLTYTPSLSLNHN